LGLVITCAPLADSLNENKYNIPRNPGRDLHRATSFAQSLAESPAAASSPMPAPAGQLNPHEMLKQMLELPKLNENHKLLSDLNGNWNYTIKLWISPDPNAKPEESKGSATRKSIMGGRYVMMDVTGKMQMPDENGKMKDMQFKGMAIEGYDNVKKKFVSSWIDNMGTGIANSEATYDPATKNSPSIWKWSSCRE